jgi:photosystem II stability/assembly factor-like uncharacterized protein
MKKAVLIISCLLFINNSIYSQNAGWQRVASGTTAKLNSVVYYGLNSWIVGNDGTILDNYQPVQFNCTQNLNKIKLSQSAFGFIAGDSGTIILINNLNGGSGPQLNLVKSNTLENLRDIAFTNNDSIVIIVGDHGTILISRTDNINFKVVSSLKNYNLSSVSFTHHGTGWAVGTNGIILKSTDAGETWENQQSNVLTDLNNVNFFDSENGWAAGDSGTILYTTNGGNDWQNYNSNININLNSSYFPPETLGSIINSNSYVQNIQNIYSITSDSKGTIYFYYVNFNSSYGIEYLDKDYSIVNYAPKGAESYFADLKFNKGDTLFAVRGVYGVFYIPKEGSRPSVWAILPDISEKVSTLDFDSNQNIWASGDKDSIYCINPAKETTIFPVSTSIKKLRIYDDYLYAIVNNADSIDQIWRYKIYSSDSLGAPELYFTMSSITTNKPAEIFDFVLDDKNDLIVCSNTSDVIDIVYSDGSFKPILQNYYPAWNFYDLQNAYLTFGGKSKKDLYFCFNNYTGSPNYAKYSDMYKLSTFPLNNFNGFFVGEKGEILSKASDDSVWDKQLSGTDLNLNSVFFFDDSNGVAVGDSGLILTTTNGGITEISDEINTNSQTLTDYTLYQNYPNPFNPSTTLQYKIPKSGFVTIKIYDVLGREIRTLVNQYQNMGTHEINFSASNLTSGIYFYRMRAGNFIETKKLILLK